VNVVNVARRFFTSRARELPKLSCMATAARGPNFQTEKHFAYTQNIPKEIFGYPIGFIPNDTQNNFGYELGIRTVSPLDLGMRVFYEF